MTWDELNQLTEPSWINLSELSDLLLSSDNLYLSGWAGEGDPLLAKAETLGEVNDEGSCFHRTVHGCAEPKETDGLHPGVSVCFKTRTRSVLRLF